ncbi:MAG: serine hydrolase domain-containing protein [Ferruginibacter sp.]
MSYKNKVNCRKFTMLLSFVLLCLIGRSQYNFAEVDKLLTDNQKVLGNKLVTLIYKDGKIVYQKELGDLTSKSKEPIASCSKWLTAAVVMTFVDEGKISLDDKVSKYLPIFEKYVKPDITIRQCLSHQTGIEDNTNAVSKFFERRKYETLEDEVNSFAQRGISAKPGLVFIYGNIGPDIAARVVEVVAKKKFDVLMKQRIFTPLKMSNSTFTPEKNAINPSGGGISTAADYMNFLTMILEKGKFMGTQVLSEKAVTEMQTMQTKNVLKKYIPAVAKDYEYGLGEWIEEVDGQGNSIVVSCPGLFGTWPYVDKCRNYACIFFIKSVLGEQKKDLYLALKKAIDKQILSTCK